VTAVQLELLPRQHIATPYPLERLWGLDKATGGTGWWAWRCTCGRDVGAERKCAYGCEASALRMAWWHMRDREPWANPLPGPPVPGR
jgi:hypothetical protein